MQLILFIGIPGSGKSTFYQQHFFHTHVRVNLDMLRTRNRENRMLHFCFNTLQPLVVDNTNVSIADRKKYIQEAIANRFRIIGYYFEASLEACLQRNAKRTGRQLISERGLKAKFYQLQKPSYAEGFDELYTVELDNNNQFIIKPLQNEV